MFFVGDKLLIEFCGNQGSKNLKLSAMDLKMVICFILISDTFSLVSLRAVFITVMVFLWRDSIAKIQSMFLAAVAIEKKTSVWNMFGIFVE